MPGRTDYRHRLLVLLLIFVVAAGAATVRLAFWQVDQRGALAAKARDQIYLRVEEPQLRGTIYDRTGLTVLATSIRHDRLVAAPSKLKVEQQKATARELIGLLGLSGTDADTLLARMRSKRAYVVLARGLDEAASAKIREAAKAGRILGVALEPEPVRVYPQAGGAKGTTLAAQLLGFVNREGAGQYGVEQYYNATLAGTPRIILAERDITNRPVSDSAEVLEPGVAGASVRLTIDAGLQLQLEQELFAAWVANDPTSVSAVVMDPKTGAILASATYPSYDANDYGKLAATNPGRFVDPTVSSVYEPGSVFKMVTAVAALDKGVVNRKTIINDSGVIHLDKGRTRVYDADRKAMGRMTFEDVIAYSRNVGATRVAMRLGKTTAQASRALYGTWRALGFGQKTGIDLAGEVSGLANDPARRTWREIDLANGSFGQGIAVTPIQLAVAYAAMVNGGMRVRPHVVGAIDGRDLDVPEVGRAIDGALSPELIRLMRHVLTTVPFYRDRTLINGYVVGGKTGTAQIWDSKARGGRGDWKNNIFNFSFVGFIGRKHPDYVIAVTIREGRPNVIRQGHLELPVQSFELFRRIATDTVTSLDLAPTSSPSPSATP